MKSEQTGAQNAEGHPGEDSGASAQQNHRGPASDRFSWLFFGSDSSQKKFQDFVLKFKVYLGNWEFVRWPKKKSLLQAYFEITSRLLQDYLKITSILLPDYFKITSRLLQDYFKTTASLLQAYFKIKSRLLQDYFKITSRSLQDCSKTT